MPPQRHHLRRGHAGIAYPQRVIDKALRLWRTGNFTFQEIADQCGVSHRSTIWHWTNHSMTACAQRLRAAGKGPPRFLTEEQESIALGWLIFRNDLFLDTSTKRFRQFLLHMKGNAPDKSWVSKFVARHGMSSRVVQPTAPEVIDPRAYHQGVAFLRSVQALGKEPSQFLFVDKVSFNMPKGKTRQIAPKGAGTIHRASHSTGPPIHVYSSLVGDGSMGPFYAVIIRKRPLARVIPEDDGKVTLLPQQKRRGERSVLAFLEEMIRRGTLQHGDVLVTDNERSWKTVDVRSHIHHHHLSHLFYPKKLGARLDPCDNSFHATFRKRYEGRVLQEIDVDLARRIQLLNEEYHATPTEAVLGCIRHCGLFEADPEHVMAELLLEGRHKRARITAVEQRHADSHLQYQDDTSWSEPDETMAIERRGRDLLVHHDVDSETSEDDE